MRKTLTCILIITILMFSFENISFAAGPTFSMAANTTNVNIGDNITLTINGQNLNDLYGFEVDVSFNRNMFDFVNANTNIKGFEVSPIVKNGVVIYAVTKVSNTTGINGNQQLCTLTFKAKSSGIAQLKLENVETINSKLDPPINYSGNSINVTVNSNNPPSNNNGGTTNDLGTVTTTGNTTTLILDTSKTLATINNTQGSQVTIDLTSVGTTKEKAVEIPKDVIIAAKDNEKDIIIKSDNVQLVLTKDSLDLSNVSSSIIVSIKDNGNANVGGYTALSNTIDINIISGDNNVTLKKPVKVTLNISKANDARKVAVYYYNETTGKWEYVGGKADKNNNTITFDAKHFSQYAALEYDKTFNDIKTHWAKDAIEVLASKHIVSGIDDNNFAPDNSITRAEFASMMIRLLGISESPYQVEFTDVKTGDWYANAIEAAYKAGIILGDGNTMRPDDKITREEMAAIAMRVYSKLTTYNEEDINKTSFSDDSQISDWAKAVVANASKLGIIQGEPNNLFAPKGNATRAEAAAVVYRLLDKSNNL
ncbi:MAG: S-layer homology domain-containing protein [Thermoanaerobacterium sp.]|nr:S-layer homology domain-containing protein [Thermoanaerobacterium sp.]